MISSLPWSKFISESTRVLEKTPRMFASSSPLASYGDKQLSPDKMETLFGEDLFNKYKEASRGGYRLSDEERDQMASAIHDWALERGATNFSHWFSPVRNSAPLLGSPMGGKRDAFLNLDFKSPHRTKGVLPSFTGESLFKSEEDGSSVPNGGLRDTQTAAAFLTWDITSPPFVHDNTLFLPSALMCHHGEALDEKTPLLRSMDAVGDASLRLLRLLGEDEGVSEVLPYVGCEQEFFVVDRDMYAARSDLVNAGRVLLGAKSPRSQEQCLNYFGMLSPRVSAFLQEAQQLLWEQGISVSTFHNEVGPAQHEICPIFAPANVAADQNMLIMHVLQETAAKHGLTVLFHEKPFSHVNGSGKHSNWSLSTDSGWNLISPGKTASQQKVFSAVFAALVWGVREHGDLLRAGIASAGNDHRLGAQEAPPAIMSLYTGEGLWAHLESVMEGGPLEGYGGGTGTLDGGARSLQPIERNLEDRNRTAPLPFCGNRLEFRAVGSSQHIGFPVAMLNALAAAGMNELCDRIEGGMTPEEAAASCLKEGQSAVFNGNGYSEAWVEEAEQRGLPNMRTVVEAVSALESPKNVALLGKLGIMNQSVVHARRNILLDSYVKAVSKEAHCLLTMTRTGILPALAQTLKMYRDANQDTEDLEELFGELSAKLRELEGALEEAEHMDATSSSSNSSSSSSNDEDDLLKRKAAFVRDCVKAPMLAIRENYTDRLESHIARDMYPFPTYEDVLFSHVSEHPEVEF